MAWSKTLPLRARSEREIVQLARSEDAIVQLKARMREPTRAQLEASAKRRGVSLNTELVDRVEKSFAEEDAFGAPEIANMARLMAAAFLRGGQRGAHAGRHPKWDVARWIHDPFCYGAAVAAVMDALCAMQPAQHAKHAKPGEPSKMPQELGPGTLDIVSAEGKTLVRLHPDGTQEVFYNVEEKVGNEG